MARALIQRASDTWQRAMERCMCVEHLPVCILNPDGSRCMLQPHIYGGES